MEIRINGQVLDVSLENEKTVGEVLSGLENFIYGSGHILSGLNIDGQTISASQIEETFLKKINEVKIIDITTNPLSELTASSLITLLDDIRQFEGLNFSEKSKFAENWKESSCALFLNEEMAELYTLCINTFENGVIDPKDLLSITEERLREVKEPLKEFTILEPALNEICEKMIELPLDIQTGKDLKASQTIQFFTSITEKILRIFYQLDTQKYILTNTDQLVSQIESFAEILKELLDAYARSDTVLVGDLAEYEVSVKVKELYTSILENCREENK